MWNRSSDAFSQPLQKLLLGDSGFSSRECTHCIIWTTSVKIRGITSVTGNWDKSHRVTRFEVVEIDPGQEILGKTTTSGSAFFSSFQLVNRFIHENNRALLKAFFSLVWTDIIIALSTPNCYVQADMKLWIYWFITVICLALIGWIYFSRISFASTPSWSGQRFLHYYMRRHCFRCISPAPHPLFHRGMQPFLLKQWIPPICCALS